MRKMKLEHLVTTGMIQGKNSRGMDGLTKWLVVRRVTDALKEMRDQDEWKVTIALATNLKSKFFNTHSLISPL